MQAAMMLEIKSDSGIEYHTPLKPKKLGSINKAGTNINNWRVSDKKMALLAMPML
jgi:hypothetical protein